MNLYSSILSAEDYTELGGRKSYTRFGGKCPTCEDTGEYKYDGVIRECEKDFDGICIQKKLFTRYELANIPYKYQRISWDIFDTQPEARIQADRYIANLDKAVRAGLGMYIYSDGLGTGKTLIACNILKEAVKAGYKAYFCPFFELININSDNRKTIEKKLSECDIICIDDVTAGTVSEKQSDLFRYLLEKTIRERVHNSMPIILTSNLDKNELLRAYDRVFSLVVSSCISVELDSSFDYRVDAMQDTLQELFEKNVAPIS